MIKIDFAEEKLASLSVTHYNKIKDILLKKINDLKKDTQLVIADDEFNDDFVNIAKCEIINKALVYIESNLKAIITYNPRQILSINQEFLNHIGIKKEKQNTTDIYYKLIEGKKNIKTLAKILNFIFNYKSFIRKKLKAYCAYDLAKDLGVRTCLYCNRISTITVVDDEKSDDGKYICRPEFDHFFIKNKYPLLSLSFYNLIPSCNICNSTLKGETDFVELDLNDEIYKIKFIHPYETSFSKNNTVFGISNISNVGIFSGDTTSYDVDWDSSKSGDERLKIENNKALFRLNEVYKEECSFRIDEILNRSFIYSDEYILSLVKLFKNNNIHDISAEEIYKQLFHTEYFSEKHQNIPLSKMNYDINEYFKINERLDKLIKEDSIIISKT